TRLCRPSPPDHLTQALLLPRRVQLRISLEVMGRMAHMAPHSTVPLALSTPVRDHTPAHLSEPASMPERRELILRLQPFKLVVVYVELDIDSGSLEGLQVRASISIDEQARAAHEVIDNLSFLNEDESGRAGLDLHC